MGWIRDALSDWDSGIAEFGLGMSESWVGDWMDKWQIERRVLEPGFIGFLARVVAVAPREVRRVVFIGLGTALEHWDGPRFKNPALTAMFVPAKVAAASAFKKAPDVIENLIEDGKIDPDNLEVGLGSYVASIVAALHNPLMAKADGDDMSDHNDDHGHAAPDAHAPAAPAKDAGKKAEPKPAAKPAAPKHDPLTGVASFENAEKARWTLGLYAVLRRLSPDQAKLLGRSMAEQPKDLEKLIGSTPEFGDDPRALPEVVALLSALSMREEYSHKEPEPSRLDKLTDFIEKIPAHLRPFESWVNSWFDNEGTSGDVRAAARRYASWLMTWGARLLALGAVGLVVILGLAVVSMLMSIYGIFWAHPAWILVGMVGIIVLRFIVPIYDIPLNMLAVLFDFLDPTDGTGMIGGTVGRFLDMVDPDRKKTPPADREPISWFTDKAVSVSLAWALVTALGCLVAMVIDPTTARPSEALMLSGASWLYFMLDTMRKGWRPVMKSDEHRYIPAELRKRFYRGSIYTSTAIGATKFIIGFALALGMGVGGTGKMVSATQQVGEQAVIARAAKAGVTLPPTAAACAEKLPELLANAEAHGTTVEAVCAKHVGEFPCTCR